MPQFLFGLAVGLLILLVARRRWVHASEVQHARMRAVEEDAEALAHFAEGLIRLTEGKKDSEALASGIVRLAIAAVGATSGAYYFRQDGSLLRRIAVEGLHPLQSQSSAVREGRFSAVAASLGPETIAMGEGLVGMAARDGRTTTTGADAVPGGVLSQVAIPVFDGDGMIGVLALAGPVHGGAFSPRAIALAERLAEGSSAALGRAVRASHGTGVGGCDPVCDPGPRP